MLLSYFNNTGSLYHVHCGKVSCLTLAWCMPKDTVNISCCRHTFFHHLLL